jgi:hypothetical protein
MRKNNKNPPSIFFEKNSVALFVGGVGEGVRKSHFMDSLQLSKII